MKILFIFLISLILVGCAGSFSQSKTNKNIYISSKITAIDLKQKPKRFKQAYKSCANLNNEYSDWRLPTI